MDNAIPEELRSDHLFLLIGGNPLPNWVAARLLLREGGQLYLVHSDEVLSVAERLSRVLVKQNLKKPVLVRVESASTARKIFDAVNSKIREFDSGQIGFNYTGGTKVMAVHSYRAIESEQAYSTQRPIFSYLDAQTLEMRFDFGHPPIDLGRHPERYPDIQLNLDVLLWLHDLLKPGESVEVNRVPVASDLVTSLVEVHNDKQSYAIWREYLRKNLKVNQRDPMKDLEWPSAIRRLAEVLAQGRELTTTLQSLCEEGVWPFRNSSQLISWLDGPWLESYVLHTIKENLIRYHLCDYGHDIKLQLFQRENQTDLVAIRGYQLHFISCIASESRSRCKEHLFEAFVRAKQLGGEEASAILICLFEDAENIRDDAEMSWQTQGRVKVIGRKELKDLATHLDLWLNYGK